MNTFIQERHNHSESCVTVEMSRRFQIVDFYLVEERSRLAFFFTDLGRNLGCKAANGFEVMLRGKDLANLNLVTTLSAYTLG